MKCFNISMLGVKYKTNSTYNKNKINIRQLNFHLFYYIIYIQYLVKSETLTL